MVDTPTYVATGYRVTTGYRVRCIHRSNLTLVFITSLYVTVYYIIFQPVAEPHLFQDKQASMATPRSRLVALTAYGLGKGWAASQAMLSI